MINKIECFEVSCDHCDKILSVYFYSEDLAMKDLSKYNWETIEGHTYCPECIEEKESN